MTPKLTLCQLACGFGIVGATVALSTAAATSAALTICLDAAADSSPVYPTNVLPSTNKDAAAVFRLASNERFNTLDFAWIAIDVGTVAPKNYEIAKGSLALQGRRAGVVRLTGLENALPVGKYRLDVWADKAPWQSRTFSVAATPQRSVEKPTDLIPLGVGQKWTYGFVQEAANGATVSLPGIVPAADGKLHATVTMSVVARENDTMKIETRRNDTLVIQEWWQVDGRGLVAVRRRDASGKVLALSPAQTLLPFPLRPQEWRYEPADHSFTQRNRLWGPIGVAVPGGSSTGVVVLTEQDSGPAATTVERWFVPGVGLVREQIVTALGGDLLSRQELVLQP